MKKIIAAAVFVLFSGPAGAGEKGGKAAEEWKDRVFTAEELKKFDGKKGQPVYVAVDGVVYDLSGVKYWKGGAHMNMHEAGEDLTSDIKDRAPKRIHKGGEILKRYPKVGVLAPEKEAEKAEAPESVPVEEKDFGLEKMCPVMEHSFVVSAKTPVMVYKGEKYYFCCPACPPQFAKDPEKYIKGKTMKAVKKAEMKKKEGKKKKK